MFLQDTVRHAIQFVRSHFNCMWNMWNSWNSLSYNSFGKVLTNYNKGLTPTTQAVFDSQQTEILSYKCIHSIFYYIYMNFTCVFIFKENVLDSLNFASMNLLESFLKSESNTGLQDTCLNFIIMPISWKFWNLCTIFYTLGCMKLKQTFHKL